MDALTDKPRLRWRVAHPLPEVLLLVVCGTIAANDDYDDIVDWGEAHLSFLRRFSAFHFRLSCADWLRMLMNRIDPDLFSACFLSWSSVKKAAWALRRVWGWRGTRYAGLREPPREGRTKP